MSLVSTSMYTVAKTSPSEALGPPPVHQATQKGETAPRCCRWCGTPMVNPRKNQQCCCAQCRQDWERSKRARRQQNAADKPKASCLWCDGAFDPVRKAQEFCCPEGSSSMASILNCIAASLIVAAMN